MLRWQSCSSKKRRHRCLRWHVTTAGQLFISQPEEDDVEVAKLLIETAPQLLTMKSEFGTTALHIAAGTGNVELAKLLIEKAPQLLTMKDTKGRTALSAAEEQNMGREKAKEKQEVAEFLRSKQKNEEKEEKEEKRGWRWWTWR
eukprot:TRINITY_DN10944_c0_g1_i7.p2 TRINITY_DN10944_c0_g1~~TRINITY_DN10944_c0_g1_i7.p2  ORF type:complete len:144 (+),score=43.14 TRINITY_DN10944_c0_g1_i7:180-611(+)